jgi:hypothetical protein
MKFSSALVLGFGALALASPLANSDAPDAPVLDSRGSALKASKHLRAVKRQQFDAGEPIDATGKGGPILGKNK